MDRRPIGVFDSGLGGLTALKKLMDVLPNENMIYLGDTGRVPYGSRSRDTIVKYTRQAAAFLRDKDVKAMVIACGTASSAAIDTLEAEFEMPIYGVVGAASAAAAAATRSGTIGVIATEATVRSGAYERFITRAMPKAHVVSEACPLFVAMVENGRTRPGDIVIETIAQEYLAPLKAAEVDTLILGCTHYPLLYDVISKTMGDGVTLIDSGAQAALLVAKELGARDLLTDGGETGTRQYYVTDTTDGFSRLASLFLEREVSESVKQIVLE